MMHPFLIQFKNDLNDEKFKFLILSIIFTFLGLTAVILIFYMDEFMSLFGFEDFPILIPPTIQSVFLDFYGDLTLFGLLVMSLGSMGIFASEIDSGSISFSLTRPISRRAYSTSKILSRQLALTTPFFIASILTWLYTSVMFETMPLELLLASFLPLFLLFIYMGFITDLFSTRLSMINTGFVSIAILIIQFALSVFEPLELLSPFAISSFWVEILTNPSWEFDFDFYKNILLLIGWSILPFLLAIFSMEKRDL